MFYGEVLVVLGSILALSGFFIGDNALEKAFSAVYELESPSRNQISFQDLVAKALFIVGGGLLVAGWIQLHFPYL